MSGFNRANYEQEGGLVGFLPSRSTWRLKWRIGQRSEDP